LKLWEHDPRTELINPTFGDTVQPIKKGNDENDNNNDETGKENEKNNDKKDGKTEQNNDYSRSPNS